MFNEASLKLQHKTTQADFANLTPTSNEIMRVLGRELTLQVFADEVVKSPADPVAGDFTTSTRNKSAKPRRSFGICVVLYGPLRLLEAVGTFAATCKLYLQHPRHCDRVVPYRNPHCLTPKTTEVIYTSQLGTRMHISPELTDDGLQDPIDLFADSEMQQHLATAQSPPALCTTLYRHQEQALTFMLQRETGWALQSESRKDIWKVGIDDFGRQFYFNIVSGQRLLTPPRDFRGGLLIDAPGLGKSLSIISLILSAKEDRRPDADGEVSLPTTLLVVPKTCKSSPRRAPTGI
jgi:SWI/SNF-related matrix-associated actin-dependent regulator of chromatin subfamily A3